MSPTRTRTSVIVAVVALIAGGGSTGTLHLAGAAAPVPAATSTVPVVPYRILDTRNGIGAAADPVTGGETIDVQIAGVGPVPSNAVGVVLNVTGTRTTEATYITAWPTGTPQTDTSVLNLTPGIDAPNGVTALLGDGGRLSLFNFTGSTDLIADVAGYLVAASGMPTAPAPPELPRVSSVQLPAATVSGGLTEVARFTTTAPAAGSLVVTVEPKVWLDGDATTTTSVLSFGSVWLCTAPAVSTEPECSSLHLVAEQDADSAGGLGNSGEHFSITRVIPVEAGPTTLYLNASIASAGAPLNLYPTDATVMWLPTTEPLAVSLG